MDERSNVEAMRQATCLDDLLNSNEEDSAQKKPEIMSQIILNNGFYSVPVNHQQQPKSLSQILQTNSLPVQSMNNSLPNGVPSANYSSIPTVPSLHASVPRFQNVHVNSNNYPPMLNSSVNIHSNLMFQRNPSSMGNNGASNASLRPVSNNIHYNQNMNSHVHNPNNNNNTAGSSNVAANNVPPQQPLSFDPERIIQIRNQLGLLLHAKNCKTMSTDSCSVRHCSIMRNVIDHLSACRMGRDCPESHCASSRQILMHYKQCINLQCEICSPFKYKSALNAPNSNNMTQNSSIEQKIHIQQPNANPNGYYSSTNPSTQTTDEQQDWTKNVTHAQRKHLIGKILEAHNYSTMVENHEKEAVYRYAHDFERETYESSRSREDYILKLAEKFYNIKKEQEEKRNAENSCSTTDEVHTESKQNHNNDSAVEEACVKLEPKIKEEVSDSSKSSVDEKLNTVTKSEINVPNCDSNSISHPPQTMQKVSQKIPPYKKKWSREELCRNLLQLHSLIKNHEDAVPFLEPVDPVQLNIPDYYKIIKSPMDLSTIQTRLEDGCYEDPWAVIDDFWLMFQNAWLYNKKNSRVYRCCSKLAETFEKHVDRYMKNMGLCCGQNYIFQPQVLYCTTQSLCPIARDAVYYYFERKSPNDVTFIEKFYICDKCIEIPGDSVNVLCDMNQPPIPLLKRLFCQRKNNEKEPEKFVNCVECGRKWHQICALHLDDIWTSGFVCGTCQRERPQKRPENPYIAKRLPSTKLAAFLEKRVNDFLKKKDAGAGEVAIKVLYSGDKVIEVKPLMRAKYCDTGTLAEQFPYRSKAIFAFQEIDGVDVCFFGLYVQEYGHECPRPNQRRVYISYLDSVFFFRPYKYRTDVYHEILVGYLQYVKHQGYTMAHIWACPPSEGDDYIFHMHPPEQKIPKPKRLQEWYQKMLEKALIERIVFDYKDIFTDAMRNCMDSPAEMPYFEGDFWSNQLEDIIREVEKNSEEVGTGQEDDGEEDVEEDDEIMPFVRQNSSGSASGSISKKKPKKRKVKRPGVTQPNGSNKRKKNTGQGGDPLLQRVYAMMDKHKDVFFNIRLIPAQSEASLGPIQDQDSPIHSELMDGRDNFLQMARERHLEFSSLRRAKFATLVMLYELHNETRSGFTYSCNACSQPIKGIRYHCNTCGNFDLCDICNKNNTHPHPLTKLQEEDDSSALSQSHNDMSKHEAHRQQIERYVRILQHAHRCRDANCAQASCMRTKSALNHLIGCQNPVQGQCPTCRQIKVLICYHARYCEDNECTLPHCQNIKHRTRQQQIKQRFQQAKKLRRRIANMQRKLSTSTTNASSPANTPTPVSGNKPHAFYSQHSIPHSSNKPVQPNSVPLNSPIQHQYGQFASPPPTSSMSFSDSGIKYMPPTHHNKPQTQTTQLPPQQNVTNYHQNQPDNNQYLSIQNQQSRHITPSSNVHNYYHQIHTPNSNDQARLRQELLEKIQEIRRSYDPSSYNQALSDFLREYPEYIEVFRELREEQKQKNQRSTTVQPNMNVDPPTIHQIHNSIAPVHFNMAPSNTFISDNSTYSVTPALMHSQSRMIRPQTSLQNNAPIYYQSQPRSGNHYN